MNGAPDVLANAVWHALIGAQADLGARLGHAARFADDLSPFAAVSDPDEPGSWEDLSRLVGAGGETVLFREDFSLPPGWGELWRGDGLQMVAPGPVGARHLPSDAGIDVVDLTDDDVPAMMALVERTQPGPFLARTHTLGPFVGVRAQGRLVAMAGTRLHPRPYREISAVCTDADHRGRGLAGLLVTRLAADIRARGERPFLQVAAFNVGAIRLYEELGFAVHRPVVYTAVVAPGPPLTGRAGSSRDQAGAGEGQGGDRPGDGAR